MLLNNIDKNLLGDVLSLTKNNPNAINLWIPKIEAIASYCEKNACAIPSSWMASVYNNTILNGCKFIGNPSAISNICSCFSRIVPYLEDFESLQNPICAVLTMITMPGDIVKTKGIIPCGTDNYKLMVETFIYSIMDICVPSDFAEDVIDIIFRLDERDPIKLIVKENANLSFMKDLIIDIENSSENSYYIRSVIASVQKVILNIIDIYINQEVACDIFTKIVEEFYCSRGKRPVKDFAIKYVEYGFENGVYDSIEFIYLYNTYRDSYIERFAAYLYESYSDCIDNKYFMSYINGLLARCGDLVVHQYNMNKTEEEQLLSNLSRISNLIMSQYHGNNIILFNDDTDEEDDNIATEASNEVKRKITLTTNRAKNKISNAYTSYKRNEQKVDDQLTKMIKILKSKFLGDTKVELIEGKKFSVISILKTALASAAIFHYSKIKFLLIIILRKVLKNKSRRTERLKLKMEIEEEIEILNEKIQDASSDGNREAKYAMMRTKKELENALTRLKIGIEADDKSIRSAKSMIDVNRRGGDMDVSSK